MNYKENLILLKLSTNESIIGSIDNDYEDFNYNHTIRIYLPLKLEVIHKMRRDGPVESVNLSPWVNPISESAWVDLNPSQIVMSTLPSAGIGKYYNTCISRLDLSIRNSEEIEDSLDTEPTDEELSNIEVEEALDELSDSFDSITIH
jgi:hypothetical protein